MLITNGGDGDEAGDDDIINSTINAKPEPEHLSKMACYERDLLLWIGHKIYLSSWGIFWN